MSLDQELMQKAKDGEDALNAWLKGQGLSYVYICQSPETFAPLFNNHVKRPDFLILIDSIGLLAVDAKNKRLHDGKFTLSLGDELQRAITFERMFRLPVWYAYKCPEGEKDVWYWISALKAVEVGKKQKGGEYIQIDPDQFVRITSNDDLGKLYTQRLSSAAKIAHL